MVEDFPVPKIREFLRWNRRNGVAVVDDRVVRYGRL